MVAIEKPLRLGHAELLTTIVEERKREGPRGRSGSALAGGNQGSLVGSPRANKLHVAIAFVERFPELRGKTPKKPARSALGVRPGEKYWLHMFDALAVALGIGLAARVTGPAKLATAQCRCESAHRAAQGSRTKIGSSRD